MLAADYSQIELRIIAALSKDQGMVNAFNSGTDIHSATASKVFDVELDQVTREQRSKAKMVNFGIIYGISAFGLSQRLNIPRKEAKFIIDSYFEKYSRIKEYMDESIDFARKNGYVKTIKNRKRYLKDINSSNAIVRGFAERNAINAPIQGSAADVIKIAMINIDEAMEQEKLKSSMILQVHDELVFDVYKPELNQVTELVKFHMENAVQIVVPLTVEIDTGSNWQKRIDFMLYLKRHKAVRMKKRFSYLLPFPYLAGRNETPGEIDRDLNGNGLEVTNQKLKDKVTAIENILFYTIAKGNDRHNRRSRSCIRRSIDQ